MIEHLELKLSGELPVTRKELFKLVNSWGRKDDFDTDDGFEISVSLSKDCYPLENLDVSKIEDLSYVFIESNYNGDLSNWDVSNCKNMNDMFSFSLFNNDSLNFWNVYNVENMEFMFYYSNFSGDISSWQFNKNIDFDFIFDGNDKFIEKYNSNQDINYDSNSFLKWFEENREKMKEINNGSKDEILDFFSFNNDLNFEKEKL